MPAGSSKNNSSSNLQTQENDVSSISMSHEARLSSSDEGLEHSSGDYEEDGDDDDDDDGEEEEEEEESDDTDDDDESESASEPMPNEISVPSPGQSFREEEFRGEEEEYNEPIASSPPSPSSSKTKTKKKRVSVVVDENYTLLLDTLRCRTRDEVTGFSQGRAIKSACEKQQQLQRKNSIGGISYSSFATGISSFFVGSIMRSTSTTTGDNAAAATTTTTATVSTTTTEFLEHNKQGEKANDVDDELDLNEMNRRLHEQKMAEALLPPPRDDETPLPSSQEQTEPKRQSCFSETTLDILGISERTNSGIYTDSTYIPTLAEEFVDSFDDEDDDEYKNNKNAAVGDGDGAVDPPSPNGNENPIENRKSGSHDIDINDDDDYQYWLCRVQKNGLDLQHAPKKYRGNKTVVLTAIEECGWAIEHALPPLRNDREVVLAAISKSGGTKKYASPELQNDIEILNMVAESHRRNSSTSSKNSRNSSTNNAAEGIITTATTTQYATPKVLKV